MRSFWDILFRRGKNTIEENVTVDNVEEKVEWTLVVTQHARERIMQRVGCKSNKVDKIARKALNGFDTTEEYTNYKNRFTEKKKKKFYFYKVHMGMVYVFTKKYETKELLLVTTYSPKGKKIKPIK